MSTAIRARWPIRSPASRTIPNVNQVEGLAESQLTNLAANLEYELAPDMTLYGNATYGLRNAKAHEQYRQPNQVIAAPGSNQPFDPLTNPNGYVGLTAQARRRSPARPVPSPRPAN